MKSNRYIPCLLSVLFPGLGQWNLKRQSEAGLFLGAWVLWWVLFALLRLPRFYPAYLLLALSGFLLFILSAWRALRSFAPNYPKGNVLWMLLLIPMAYLSFSGWARLAMHMSGFKLFSDPSSAMAPTIQLHDRLVADMREFHNEQIRRGYVVLLQRPNHVVLIKRVIAVGGDVIQGQENEVALNGQKLVEPYVQHTGNAPDYLRNFGPIQVPQNKLFVMGDNRDLSLDSRSPEFGLVDESSVIGRPLYRVAAKQIKSSATIR